MNAMQAKAEPKKVKLGDKEYNFILDLTAFCNLEEAWEKLTGKRNIIKAIKWDDLNLRETVIVIWAGLLAHHPDITLAEVQKLVGLHNLQPLQELVAEMLGLVMPQATPEEQKEAQEKAEAEGKN